MAPETGAPALVRTHLAGLRRARRRPPNLALNGITTEDLSRHLVRHSFGIRDEGGTEAALFL
jgi:hypothetical protein